MHATLFSHIGQFIDLTAEEQEMAAAFFIPRKFRKRQYLLHEGQVNSVTSFILSGITRMYEVDEKGQEHVVLFAMENWWAGDLVSFLEGQPSRFNIDCMEDTTVLQITKENLELLYIRVPKMERYFRILIQNALIASTRRVTSTLTRSAAERYSEFLEKYPEIDQRVPNHQVASYLGITPQSLSRIRSKTQKKLGD